MPALYLFGRRTMFGGDDLQPAAYAGMVLRSTRLLFGVGPVLAKIIHLTHGHWIDAILYDPAPSTTADNASAAASACRHVHFFPLLMLAHLVASILFDAVMLLWFDASLAYWSGQGTPTTGKLQRTKHVTTLLENKLIPCSLLLAVIWSIGISATAYARAYFTCLGYATSDPYNHDIVDANRDSSTVALSQQTDFWENADMVLQANIWVNANALPTATLGNSTTTGSTLHFWWLAWTLLLGSQFFEFLISWMYLASLLVQPPRSNVLLFPNINDASEGVYHGSSSSPVSLSEGVYGVSPSSTGVHYQRAESITNNSTQDSESQHLVMEELFARRCAAMCKCLSLSSCFLFGGREVLRLSNSGGASGGGAILSQGPFGYVARALADFVETRGVLDVVLSDIVAGLAVVQRLQQQAVYNARHIVRQQQSGSIASLGANINAVTDVDHCTLALPNAESFGAQERSPQLNGPDEWSESNAFKMQRCQSSHSIHRGTAGHDACPLEDGRAVSVAPASMPLSRRAYSIDSSLPDLLDVSEGPFVLSSSAVGRMHSRQTQFQTQFASEGLHESYNSQPPPSISQQPLRPPTTTPHQEHSYYKFHRDGTWQRQQQVVLSPNDIADMSLLAEGARYAKHALAIYAAGLYLYDYPVTGPFRLILSRARCRSSCLGSGTSELNHPDARLSDGDNCFQTQKTALLLTIGIDAADLVYAQFRNSFRDHPYCITLDHEYKNVVLSVRGTFSLEDCVTDVLIAPEPLESLGNEFRFDASGQYCHGGALTTVHNVYRDLQRHGLLEQLMLGESAMYSDYSLRLVGHSLGAATCTILSLMLRPKFPTLRCIGYSPPGCSITWKLATECKDWCTSFVLDSDIVPRLSIDSVERLRDEILNGLGRIKVSKIEIASRLVDGAWRGGCLLCRDQDSEEDLAALTQTLHDILYEPDQIPDTEYQRQLRRFRAIQHERRLARGPVRSVKLYPPGKIIHLIKTGERASCYHSIAKCLTCCTTSYGSEYVPVYLNNDDLDEIVVSPTMGTDHITNRIRAVLEEVAMDFGLSL